MKRTIKVPYLGVNDSDCKLSSWEVAEGSFVKAGTLVCVVETTKTSFEVFSETEGYIYYAAKVGDTLIVNDIAALVSEKALDNPQKDIDALKKELKKDGSKDEENITKKAEILINSLGLDKKKILAAFPGTRITEAIVKEYVDKDSVTAGRRGFSQVERVAIIGGVSGGGALIVAESIERNGRQRAVCIFDQNKEFHGKEVLGVPVVGDITQLEGWFTGGKIDVVVIAFNRDLKERERVFNEIKSKNIPFTNVIDTTAELRTGVKIGVGNVILGRAYIGACSVIGDNNFISANVCLEHGNILGSHSAFGPGVFTSGNVTMGNTIRFATGIFIEPNIEIGDDAVISSGSIITDHVRPGEVTSTRKANK